MVVAVTTPAKLVYGLAASSRRRLLLLLQLFLMVPPPLRESMEESERLLGGLVDRHLMFVLAALLCKGAGSIVDPFVAVDFGAALLSRRNRNDAVNLGLEYKVSIL
jgi:hypothetical protein